MLSQILDLIEKQGQVSIMDIAIRFHMNVSAAEPMMDLLLRNGKVEVVSTGCPSRLCAGCPCSSCGNSPVYRTIQKDIEKKGNTKGDS